MSLTVLIIGLGKIGMMYDLESPSYKTHLSSIIKSKKLILLGAVEKSQRKRKFFRNHFNKPAYSNLLEATNELKPSIIVISVNTNNAIKIYDEIIQNKLKFKAILFEKPVTNNLKKAIEIFNYCKIKNIHVFVNYLRRYDKSTEKLKNILIDNKLGLIEKIDVTYKKGFFNSCSHYINYLDYLFDLNKKVQLQKITKFSKHDVHVKFVIEHNFNIYFNYKKNKILDEKINIIGELGSIEYLTEKGMIKVSIKNKEQILRNHYNIPLKSVYKYIVNVLSSNSKPKSSITDSLKCLEIMNSVLKKTNYVMK